MWLSYILLAKLMFSRSRNPMDSLSQSYRYCMTSKIQFEPEVLDLQRYPWFSLIEICFSNHTYVFEVKESNGHTFCSHTTIAWPRKSSLNRKYWNFKVTHDSPLSKFVFSTTLMLSRSKNQMDRLSQSYRVWRCPIAQWGWWPWLFIQGHGRWNVFYVFGPDIIDFIFFVLSVELSFSRRF